MKRSLTTTLMFAAAAALLAGCVKFPKPGKTEPDNPEGPDSPPLLQRRLNTSILSGMNPGM